MQAEGAGKEGVAEGYLGDILVRGAGGDGKARNAAAPHIKVLAGIAHHGGLAGGAAGGVDAHDALHGNGKKPVGIIVTHIGLCGKGDMAYILKSLQIVGMKAGVVQLLFVVGYIFVGKAHLLLQPCKLHLPQLLSVGSFDLPVVIIHTSPFFCKEAPCRTTMLLHCISVKTDIYTLL